MGGFGEATVALLGSVFGPELSSLQLNLYNYHLAPSFWPALLHHLPGLHTLTVYCSNLQPDSAAPAALAYLITTYSGPPMLRYGTMWADITAREFDAAAALRAALHLPQPPGPPSAAVKLQLPRA